MRADEPTSSKRGRSFVGVVSGCLSRSSTGANHRQNVVDKSAAPIFETEVQVSAGNALIDETVTINNLLTGLWKGLTGNDRGFIGDIGTIDHAELGGGIAPGIFTGLGVFAASKSCGEDDNQHEKEGWFHGQFPRVKPKAHLYKH